MRVLLVGQALSGGGAENRLKLLAKHTFGGETDVAVLRASSGIDTPSAIDLGWRGRHSYAKVILRLRALLVRNDYDVVMAFGMFPNIISAIAVRSCRRRPKLIINEITRPMVQAKGSGWFREGVYLSLQRLFYPLSDLVTANSIDGLAEACSLARIPVEEGRRTPNVMDMDALRLLAKRSADIPTMAPYFICVSRLDRMKRIDTVIDAWVRMRGKIDARLLIVGDGEARRELELQVASNGLEDSVFFTGVSANPMPLLAHSAGFILASEYEGFSNSVLEAMCLDVPVITSLCSSDAMRMCQLEAALGFDVGDSDQLAGCVQKLLASRVLADNLIARAADYRQAHLSPLAIQEYEHLILGCADVAIRDRRGGGCAG